MRPIDLSAYAYPVLDELVSGEPVIDGTVLLDLAREAEGPILDLGCGYGRITIPLAERGITALTGLDLSAPSLAHARSKAGDLAIRWVEGDARDFDLGERFALIYAKGSVLEFMLTRRDQEAMLARVREHLSDSGRFLCDFSDVSPSQMTDTLEEVPWFTYLHPNGRTIHASGTDRYDYAAQLWIQTCWERWDAPDGELVRPPWTVTLRYTMPQEREALLHYNGFRILSKYAAHDGTPETAQKPATIYVCEKH